MEKTLILNYNRIITGREVLRNKDARAIPRTAFIQQLDLIQKKGIPIVSMSDWIKGRVQHDFAVILTFDEGNESDYREVFPLLEERNISGTFFPVLSFVEGRKKLTWAQLREMSEYGYEIGSHGVFNKNMSRSGSEACKLELELSKRILEQKIGTAVQSFAAPFGVYNRKVLRLALHAGYKRVFSTRLKMNHDAQAFILHRWNISRHTSIQAFDKTIRKGAMFYRDRGSISKIKNRISRCFEMGLLDATNEFLLKLNKHQF